MNNIMIFENMELEILSKDDVNFEFNGEVLFNGKQVAEILEYKRPSDAVRDNVRECYKYKVKNSNTVGDRNRKLHNTGEIFITEKAVMKLIINSKMPKADEFEDLVWEIIYSVQKTGRYDSVEQKIKLIEDQKERELSLAIYQLERYVKANPSDIIGSLNLVQKKQELISYKQGREISYIKGQLENQSQKIENMVVIGDRKQFTNEVNCVARSTGKKQDEIYSLVYKELENEYGICLNQRCINARNKLQEQRLNEGKKPLSPSTLKQKVSKLNIADEENLWNELGKCLYAVKNRLMEGR